MPSDRLASLVLDDFTTHVFRWLTEAKSSLLDKGFLGAPPQRQAAIIAISSGLASLVIVLAQLGGRTALSEALNAFAAPVVVVLGLLIIRREHLALWLLVGVQASAVVAGLLHRGWFGILPVLIALVYLRGAVTAWTISKRNVTLIPEAVRTGDRIAFSAAVPILALLQSVWLLPYGIKAMRLASGEAVINVALNIVIVVILGVFFLGHRVWPAYCLAAYQTIGLYENLPQPEHLYMHGTAAFLYVAGGLERRRILGERHPVVRPGTS
jgi:hypothetical protein